MVHGYELGDRSTVFAEAWAIYRGLQYVNSIIKRTNKTCDVLVVSDSKLNITVFNEYVKHVWNTSDWNVWKKRNGETVKNQDLYRNMVELIDTSDMRVKFVHMNSHMELTDIDRLCKKLAKYDVTVSSSVAPIFIKMNALADKTATDITYKMKNGRSFATLIKKKNEVSQ